MFLKSLIACSVFYEFVRCIPSRVRYASNLRTCIAFQLYFLWRAGSLLYASLYPPVTGEDNTKWIQTETMNNLSALAGYFVYDLAFLLQTSPFARAGFIFHHLIGLGIIRYLHQVGTPPVHLLTTYNAMAFIVEVTNPLLNLHAFLKGTWWERLNTHVIFWMYTVFRIVLYPLMGFHLHQHIRMGNVFVLFMTVYVMSLVWYRRIIRMTWSSLQ